MKAAVAPSAGGGDQAPVYVKAQYAYNTAEPNELSFAEGDIIKVISFAATFLLELLIERWWFLAGYLSGRQWLVGGRTQRSSGRVPVQSCTSTVQEYACPSATLILNASSTIGRCCR